MPVFVLCGGLGTRLREETEFRPKPMIPIGEQPILWHIMRTYAHHGFRRFILCLGYKAELIMAYFLNYTRMQSDVTVDLKDNSLEVHAVNHSQDWQVTLAHTGDVAMTGARVARAAGKYLGDAEHFAVTYGDGLTDANLCDELAFHASHARIGTVLGVNPPSRFGELKTEGDRVTQFDEKPSLTNHWINGGYFLFRRSFLRYLSTDDGCVLERGPLIRLAHDGELCSFKWRGFWACMDTQRDREHLDKMWSSGSAPWAVAEEPPQRASVTMNGDAVLRHGSHIAAPVDGPSTGSHITDRTRSTRRGI